MSNRLVVARKKRRRMLVEALGGTCVGCGTTEKLEFDHVFRETMDFRIGTALLMKLEKLLPELQKCQLLCHSCHIDKTNSEYKRTVVKEHGTASMYNNRGCRCDKCRKAWNIYLKTKNYYRKSIA